MSKSSQIWIKLTKCARCKLGVRLYEYWLEFDRGRHRFEYRETHRVAHHWHRARRWFPREWILMAKRGEFDNQKDNRVEMQCFCINTGGLYSDNDYCFTTLCVARRIESEAWNWFIMMTDPHWIKLSLRGAGLVLRNAPSILRLKIFQWRTYRHEDVESFYVSYLQHICLPFNLQPAILCMRRPSVLQNCVDYSSSLSGSWVSWLALIYIYGHEARSLFLFKSEHSVQKNVVNMKQRLIWADPHKRSSIISESDSAALWNDIKLFPSVAPSTSTPLVIIGQRSRTIASGNRQTDAECAVNYGSMDPFITAELFKSNNNCRMPSGEFVPYDC